MQSWLSLVPTNEKYFPDEGISAGQPKDYLLQYLQTVRKKFRTLCRRLHRDPKLVETELLKRWILAVRTAVAQSKRNKTHKTTRRSYTMPRKKVEKPAPAGKKSDELDDELGGADDELGGADDELGLGDDDLLGDDLSFDGADEVDDLGVTEQDVAEAMSGITDGGVSEAALADITAAIGNVEKKQDTLFTQLDNLSKKIAKEFESLTALIKSAPKATPAAGTTAPAKAKGEEPTAHQEKTEAEVDAYLKAQYKGMKGGTTYNIDQVAAVFAKRLAVAPEYVKKRIEAVYKNPIASAGKPGHFKKKADA